MKKALIVISLVILVSLLVLFFMRHEIIGHVFKVSISEKTHSSVELNIGHVYYDIFNSTVTLEDSDLSFHNIFVNKEKTVVLSDFKFKDLSLVNLSILKLIFKHEVIASKFIINTPSLWFQEDNNPKPFKEKPDEIIKSLKKHPDLLGDLKIVVGLIEITHGKVDLTSLLDEDENKGSVEFILLLKDINTSEARIFDENSFLFAKHHLFKLSNFNYLLPNGDLFSFDSLVYGSDSNLISISNINLNIQDTSIHSKILSLDAKLGSLELLGVSMDNIDSIRDLVIDSIVLSNGYININRNHSYIKPEDNSVAKKPAFPKLLNSISLSKLIFANINMTSRLNQSFIDLENLDLQIDDLRIDSVSLSKGKPYYNKQSIILGLEEFQMKDPDIGLFVTFSDLELDEEKRLLHIYDVHVNDSISGDHSVLVDMDYLKINGVSIDKQLNKKEMKLAVKIHNPDIIIDLEKIIKKSKKGNNLSLENIIVDEIDVYDGNVHFSKHKNLELTIEGLNVNWDSIGFSERITLKELNTKNLNLEFSKLSYKQFDNPMFFKLGSTTISNYGFHLNSLVAKINESKLESDFTIKSIVGKGTNLKKLITDNEISFNSIYISKPNIVANIFSDFGRKTDNAKGKSNVPDVKINIGELKLGSGRLDLSIENNKPIKVKSNFSIATSNIRVDDFSNNTWLYNMDWDINLFNTSFENTEIKVVCSELLSNKKYETFTLANASVEHLGAAHKDHGFEIIDVSIPELVFEGINYNSFVDGETPMVKSARIRNANIDLLIVNDHSSKKKEHNKPMGAKLPFELDELKLDNLKFNLNKRDSISITNYNVERLDVEYHLDSAINLVDDLRVLQLENFSTSNNLKNSYMAVGNITNIDSVNGFAISNISGGTIHVDSNSNQHIFELQDIDFQHMYISHTVPVNIDLGVIDIGNGYAKITSHGKKDNAKKAQIPKIKLPEILETISVDKFSLDKFNLFHTTITDSVNNNFELKNLGLEIDSIFVDSNSINTTNYNFVKSASVYLGDNSFISKDSLYSSSLKSITYYFNEQKVIIDSIEMMPRFDDDEFFDKAVYQTGRMKLVLGSLECSDFQVNTLIEDNVLHIGGIDAYGLNLDIYRNKLYEMNPKAYKKMPQEAILGINQTIIIDSLRTHDGYIQYMEIDKKSVVPGKLFLDRFNVSVYNVNNDLRILDNSSFMEAKLDARLFGQADLQIDAVFPILSPSNDFWFSGHMVSLDFSELNNLTENIVGITMARGSGALDIPLISGNSVYSEGSILFKYNKLKIELYNRDKAQIQKGLTGGMASLLLNDVFIKSNNPGFLGKTRPGDVYFRRNTQKSIVAFMWKSIMSGLMSTMGYNNKEQRQEKRAMKQSNKRQ